MKKTPHSARIYKKRKYTGNIAKRIKIQKKTKRNSEKYTTEAKGVVGCFKTLSVCKIITSNGRITDEG
jgi:hypothetical protein